MTKTKPTAYLLDIKKGLQNFGVKIICLSLSLWRNVTQRDGEDGGLLKQSNGSHGGTVGAQSNGACLPILLAIYIQSIYPKVFIPKHLSQSIYPKVFIKNLYATPPLLIVPSAPPRHCVYLRHLRDIAFYLRPLRSSVCLLYKTFSLSPHISEEPKISHIYLEYRG